MRKYNHTLKDFEEFCKVFESEGFYPSHYQLNEYLMELTVDSNNKINIEVFIYNDKSGDFKLVSNTEDFDSVVTEMIVDIQNYMEYHNAEL